MFAENIEEGGLREKECPDRTRFFCSGALRQTGSILCGNRHDTLLDVARRRQIAT
jgi:hypothetical protein